MKDIDLSDKMGELNNFVLNCGGGCNKVLMYLLKLLVSKFIKLCNQADHNKLKIFHSRLSIFVLFIVKINLNLSCEFITLIIELNCVPWRTSISSHGLQSTVDCRSVITIPTAALIIITSKIIPYSNKTIPKPINQSLETYPSAHFPKLHLKLI